METPKKEISKFVVCCLVLIFIVLVVFSAFLSQKRAAIDFYLSEKCHRPLRENRAEEFHLKPTTVLPSSGLEVAMNSPSRPFGIPALFSLQSLQQVVMTSGGVGGLPTVVTMAPVQQLTTLSVMSQSPIPQPIITNPITKSPSLPTAQLYLCRTSKNATGKLMYVWWVYVFVVRSRVSSFEFVLLVRSDV